MPTTSSECHVLFEQSLKTDISEREIVFQDIDNISLAYCYLRSCCPSEYRNRKSIGFFLQDEKIISSSSSVDLQDVLLVVLVSNFKVHSCFVFMKSLIVSLEKSKKKYPSLSLACSDRSFNLPTGRYSGLYFLQIDGHF